MTTTEKTLRVLPARGREWEQLAERMRAQAAWDQYMARCRDMEAKHLTRRAPILWSAPTELLNVIPYGPVRSPVRGSASDDDEGGGGVVTQTISTLTTTSGTDTTATGSNDITIPTGYDGLMVWVDSGSTLFPLTRFRLVVNANVGGNAKVFHLHRGQCIVINAAAGSSVSFATQERVKDTYTLSNVSVSLKVCPIIKPSSLTAPTAATGTVNCDKSGPPFWAPTAAGSHVTLAAEHQIIQIDSAAARREIFLVEFDSEDNATPVRHIHCPAGVDVKVQCRFTKLAFANYDGSTIDITTESGSTIGGTSTEYRPSYTVSGTTRTVSASDDGFGGDQGTVTQNLIYCLKNITDGDDVVIPAGTYDFSGSGNPLVQANYTTSMTRNVRIRSATGNPADVIFTGATLNLVIAENKQWIFEGITFTLNGLSGILIQTLGHAHFHKCILTGPSSTSTSPNLYVQGTSAFATTPVWSFCTNQTSAEDNYDTNSQTNCTLIVFGGTAQGNGSGANDQLVTSHDGSKIQCWGTKFSDATATSNLIRIWPDNNANSEIHLLYCKSLTADITNTEGIEVRRCATMHFCTFEKTRLWHPTTAGGAGSCICWIGNRIIRATASTGAIDLRFEFDANSYSLLCGNWYTSIDVAGGSNDHGYDLRRTVESVGNQIQCVAASSAVPLRVSVTGGPGSAQSNVRVWNDRYIAANALFEIGTLANLGVDMTNVLFTGSAVNMAVGASGANCSARNYYAERSSAPTNWTTRFTTDTNGTFSTTDVAFDGDGITPSAVFLSANPGLDPGYRGGIDILGRALILGGSDTGAIPRGPVERQAIRTGACLFPAVW